MKKCIIAVGSVTLALKGVKRLSDVGINGEVVRLPPEATRLGCGYGISVECGFIPKAKTALSEKGIVYHEILVKS